MNRKIAIVGCHQTKYCGRYENESLTDLIFQCSKDLLAKYKLNRWDIDQFVIAADDLLDGRSISSMVTVGPAGGHHKEWMKVSGDGSFAVAYAYLGIAAGLSDLTAVIGWSKIAEVPFYNVTNLTFDPFYHRPFFDEGSSKAMQAQKYAARYNINERQAAIASVKNRLHGCKNPFSHMKEKITTDEVISSKLIASPIRELDNCTRSEGACAILLASEKRAKDFTNPAWISGISWDTDTYYMGDRDLSELTSLKRAAAKAYKMSGIINPFKEIDVAEISDISSYHELMAYEALGFCGSGEGGLFIESGATQLNGDLPVNPSGGLISSNPGCAAGLARVAEAYLQIAGQAGEHQVANANIALAHGIQGNACQTNCVVIMKK